MERNYRAEIETLKEELHQIKELLTIGKVAQTPENSGEHHKKVGHIEKMENMHTDPSIMAILDKLENTCGSNGDNG